MTRVTVVGDALLDVDWIGTVERVTPDAPAPVLDAEDEVRRPGGAAQAAMHAASLGAEVTLVTALGGDDEGAQVADSLRGLEVRVVDLGLDGRTPTKLRLRAAGQSLGRVDRHCWPLARPGAWTEAATGAVTSADAVLISDYGRGIAGIPALSALLHQVADGAAVVWDPHRRGPRPPQGRLDLLTPNVGEATHLVGGPGPAPGDRNDEVVSILLGLATRLRSTFDCAVALTAGQRGAVVAEPGREPLVIPVDPVVGDECGAGDRFAATVAVERSRQVPRPEAVARAVEEARRHVAGATATGPASGPSSFCERDVVPEHHIHLTEPAGRPGVAGAVALAERVRREGGTVVAAGGCFDVVHAGHVQLLQRARQLGDCLVVCLNSDRSARRLKGRPRPVNPVADRIAVLDGLRAVDAVAVFDEDTPCSLLEQLRPHLFVKGGDYGGQPLPERRVMAAWDGQVVLLPTMQGRSTTRILHAVAGR